MEKDKFDIESFLASEAAKRMMASIDESFYEKSYVMKWMQQVMGLEWDDAWNIIVEELPKQFFPETDTWGLRYHEEKWQLPVRENLSYEERRKLIYRKRDYRAPMTPYRMEQYLEKITGGRAFVMDCHDAGRFGFVPEHPNVFKAAFIVEGTLDVKAAREALARIKQSHTVCVKITDYVMAAINHEKIETAALQKIWIHSIISFFGTRLLNGSHLLDGSRRLDAGRRYWLVVGISCRTGPVQNREKFSFPALIMGAGINTGWKNTTSLLFRAVIRSKPARKNGSAASRTRFPIRGPQGRLGAAAVVTKTKDYRFLNGSKLLDGSKKLDSVYREEKL